VRRTRVGFRLASLDEECSVMGSDMISLKGSDRCG
jgi:hypothetical protein